ncbi:hypothetical protein BJ165DRAFT_1526542 [Panaeolus papilionaceus]|nr:hypothetical protein BJ165DRAFT_1526542 [Panaeolus papilionaceus]
MLHNGICVPGSIMGPTGAGKSSFIEALAGDSQTLSISKNQLAGYTQTVTAYHLKNVKRWGGEIYVVDSPGFADSKISESEIMDMVRKWLRDNRLTYIHHILFFIPINETRLAGTKRRTIEMIKAFLRPTSDLSSVQFVTTMWDTLHNERMLERAESNFAQLRDEILKEFTTGEAKITRFENTRNSALHVLDSIGRHNDVFANGPVKFANIYHDLLDRIANALQEKKNIEADLAQEDTQQNPDLKSIMEQRLQENKETLRKFIKQFVDFGKPMEGYEVAAVQLRKAIWKSRISIPVTTRYQLGMLDFSDTIRPLFCDSSSDK